MACVEKLDKAVQETATTESVKLHNQFPMERKKLCLKMSFFGYKKFLVHQILQEQLQLL